MWTDFSHLVEHLTNGRDTQILLSEYNGDQNLRLRYSPQRLVISATALCESAGHINSLEYLNNFSQSINREISFICFLDEEQMIIKQTLMGEIGGQGLCEWDDQLLAQSLEIARVNNWRIMLGHTHPAGYGPICSDIYYKKSDDFGGDYTDILYLMKSYSLISSFHLIMSPFEDQLGIFELKPEGIVIYHPWVIEK